MGQSRTSLNNKEEEVVQGDPVSGTSIATRTGSSNSTLQRKASISEVATEATTPHCSPPTWLANILEFPFRVKNPVTEIYLPEATAWAMDAAGRGPLNQVGGFVGTAILRLAIREAGCTTTVSSSSNNDVSSSACRLKSGFKATSLLTFTSAVVGVAAAILMPILGAVVDHTPHRKTVGALSAGCVVLFTGLYMSVSESSGNWQWILTVDSFQAFFLLLHVTSSFAYLPDLSTDEEAIVHYTSSFSVRQYVTQLLYAIAVLAAGIGQDRSIVSTVRLARDASAMAFGISAILFLYSWTFLFRPRPALSKVPPGQTLLTTGFRQVKSTVVSIGREYTALKWFMISILWSPEHGSGVILAIVVSWLISEVGFIAKDMAIVNVILLATSAVGAKLSIVIVHRINALNSYRIGLFCFACIIGVSVAIVNGPNRRKFIYGLTAAWGTNLGWIYASQRVLFCTLIPKGQELELMGLFAFVGQILGWLPPLLVTILNERGVNLRYGLLVVAGFCILAVMCTLPMGDYTTATDFAMAKSQSRLSEISLATTRKSIPEMRIVMLNEDSQNKK